MFRAINKFIWCLAGAALLTPVVAVASPTNGTIDSSGQYAWSNQSGWINFGVSQGDIHITDSALTGFAWSANYGWLNLSPATGGVINNGAGVLSGYAWGAALGWINFAGVTIDNAGIFHGNAAGDIIGTLAFDCAHCAVATDWRPASVRSIATPVPVPGGGVEGGSLAGFFPVITDNSALTIAPAAKLPLSAPGVTALQLGNPGALSQAGRASSASPRLGIAEFVNPNEEPDGVSSFTHPDQSAWYNAPDVDIAWPLPPNVTAVRWSLNQNPDSEPTTVSIPPIRFKRFKNLSNGVWYFHSQFKTGRGWSDSTHFALHIDTEAPRASTIVAATNPGRNGSWPVLTLAASDAISGVDHVTVKVDNGDYVSLPAVVSSGQLSVRLPANIYGPHNIFAQVFDHADNYVFAAGSVDIPSGQSAARRSPSGAPWWRRWWATIFKV